MRLVARGIAKAFGGTRALGGVDLEIRPGSVHALLGENGAGKSTLIKIVAGALAPDAGKLLLDGDPFLPAEPLAARKQGVAVVYQELSVCPHLTVAENVLLGVEPERLGFISRKKAAERVGRALSRIVGEKGDLSPGVLLGSLSAAEQQLVEIARALAAENARLLILDEPTSSLGGEDVERLFSVLRTLREQGLGILYISHFLEEVRRIADDFTVLRDGQSVMSGRVAEVDNDELVRAMTGRSLIRSERSLRAAGDPVLSIRELAGERFPVSASLELRRGEVLGIAGLLGSGRTELLRALFGLDRVVQGELRVGVVSGPRSPFFRLRQGVGLLSEDRKREGLALSLSLSDNLTLSRLEPLKRRGLLSRSAERAAARKAIERLKIRCTGPDQPVSALSGGNQQKVALGRLLYHDVDVLLLDEPTRGIDVGSRAEIHALIDELARSGKAVLIVSSQLPELVEICDRVAVMRRGVLGPARPVSELSEHQILLEAVSA